MSAKNFARLMERVGVRTVRRELRILGGRTSTMDIQVGGDERVDIRRQERRV